MFDRPEVMRMAQALATHSGARQAEIARNVANADTPGYRARDVVAFEKVYHDGPAARMKTTRTGHETMAPPPTTVQTVVDARSEPSPNGNSVSLELEMVKASEVRSTHDMALAIYKSSLDLMRTAIGRG